MKKYIALIALFLLPTTSNAITGDDLLGFCTQALRFEDKLGGGDSIEAGMCIGYISGVAHTGAVYHEIINKDDAQWKPIFCIPSRVQGGQLIRIVVKYLKDNPSQLHDDGTLSTMTAYKEAFPCK